MSVNAATEQHANAKSDDDLSTTQDPCMSAEASVEGTSAECAEMTSVVLKSTPHGMQNQLHSSLPLTSRPPIEGKPNTCKQEAAESIVMAGCTNRMAEMVKPTVADINRTAMLGEDLATAACGVDEGDGMECETNGSSNKRMYSAKRHVSAMQMQMNTYLAHMDCHLRGSGQDV